MRNLVVMTAILFLGLCGCSKAGQRSEVAVTKEATQDAVQSEARRQSECDCATCKANRVLDEYLLVLEEKQRLYSLATILVKVEESQLWRSDLELRNSLPDAAALMLERHEEFSERFERCTADFEEVVTNVRSGKLRDATHGPSLEMLEKLDRLQKEYDRLLKMSIPELKTTPSESPADARV